MTARVALTLVLAAALAGGAAARVDAQPRTEPVPLHDARYCEILELRGTVPDAVVVVWNTIGLNRCPPARWNAIDASALAAELGATAVVLNGPRHFLMDSAKAAIGRTRAFAGIRMRRVAAIPIRTAAELVQVPYTERTIERDNTWTWNSGRRVFELRAPGGSRYLMQSYALIRDPEQTIGSLRSLGTRLDLPSGWTYRTRRLGRSLTLTADGEATIIQDSLLNTYQELRRR